jgi:transcriptional regulator with XRE-family HTH domain
MNDYTFSQLLETYMARAGIDPKELAQQVGVHRSSVSRWLSSGGKIVPRKRTILRMREALGLKDREAVLLLQKAYPELSPSSRSEEDLRPATGDTVLKAADGRLYLYRYSPDKFPSEWSISTLKQEKTVRGPMVTLFSTFPAVVRPPELYELYADQGFYEPDVVGEYIRELRERQKAFRDRLSEYSVRHVYHRQSLVHLLTSGRWRQVQVPEDILARQVDLIVKLLDDHPSFYVGLYADPIPLHVTVIGHRVALVEMLHYEHPAPVANVFGFETTKPEVVLALEEQFDSVWESPGLLRESTAVQEWFRGGWREDARKLRDQLDHAIQREAN